MKLLLAPWHLRHEVHTGIRRAVATAAAAASAA